MAKSSLQNRTSTLTANRWLQQTTTPMVHEMIPSTKHYNYKEDYVLNISRKDVTVIQMLRLNRAPTDENLHHWGHQNEALCQQCKQAVGTVTHILTACPTTRRERNRNGWRNWHLKDILFGKKETLVSVAKLVNNVLHWR